MKKWIIIGLTLALIAAAAFFGMRYYEQSTYLELHGAQLRRDVTTLDLSGTKNPDLDTVMELTGLQSLNLTGTEISAESYEQLKTALPDCEILWEVPFRDQYLSPDITELEITSLTRADMEALSYFENLQRIDATGCDDLELIAELKSRLPECSVLYRVSIGGMEYAGTTTLLSLENGDLEELKAVIPHLPDLNRVKFTGTMPDSEAVYALKEAYPNICFVWDVTLFGNTYPSTVKEIDFSGIPMESVEEVENSLKYFYQLEKVVMCDCGIPSEEMDALWKRHPETRFVWSVPIRFFTVRTDATTLMPYQYGCTMLRNADAQELKYLVDMVCIDFGHMGISDLSFLEYMPNLEYLIIVECNVTDISPLANLKKLKYLELFMNAVTDISPLAECTSLRDVNLCFNPITDISPLFGLEKLENIWASGLQCPLEQLDTLAETFPNANMLIHRTHSSTAYGWRKIPGYYEQRDLLGMWYTHED